MFGENKIFDPIGKIHEDKEDGNVLDPAPLDDLPKSRGVSQGLFRVAESGRDGEILRPLANNPVLVGVLKVDTDISGK